MPALNYHHLRLFWAVAHQGSLTRAAAWLNLSQSAVSVQLGALERQLGHALFERAGKRLLLTEAGRIALDHADVVFQAGDELLSTLGGRPAAQGQPFRVGALPTLSRNFQLEFLRPLLGQPGVVLTVESGALRDLLAQLEAHALDVVLANAPAPRDARIPWRSHLLSQQPVSLVGPPGRASGFSFPGSLRGTPLVLPSRGSEVRAAFDRLLDQAGIQPAILAEVDDMAMLRLLAREGGGVALVPPIVVRDELEAGLLVECCRIPGVTEDFHAITQQRRFPNPLLAGLLARPIRPPLG